MTTTHHAPAPGPHPATAGSASPRDRGRQISATIVRYRVRPGFAAENAELVAAVYDELHELEPEGLRYATFALEDGVSFVHVAITDEGHDAPLTRQASFARFRESLAERCDEPPQVTRLAGPVGSYRM